MPVIAASHPPVIKSAHSPRGNDTVLPTVDLRPFVPYVWERGRSYLTSDEDKSLNRSKTNNASSQNDTLLAPLSKEPTDTSPPLLPHLPAKRATTTQKSFKMVDKRFADLIVAPGNRNSQPLVSSNISTKINQQKLSASLQNSSLIGGNNIAGNIFKLSTHHNIYQPHANKNKLVKDHAFIADGETVQLYGRTPEHSFLQENVPVTPRNNSPADNWLYHEHATEHELSSRMQSDHRGQFLISPNKATAVSMSRITLDCTLSPVNKGNHLHRNRTIPRHPFPAPPSLDFDSPGMGSFCKLYNPTPGEMSLMVGRKLSRIPLPVYRPFIPKAKPKPFTFTDADFSDEEEEQEAQQQTDNNSKETPEQQDGNQNVIEKTDEDSNDLNQSATNDSHENNDETENTVVDDAIDSNLSVDKTVTDNITMDGAEITASNEMADVKDQSETEIDVLINDNTRDADDNVDDSVVNEISIGHTSKFETEKSVTDTTLNNEQILQSEMVVDDNTEPIDETENGVAEDKSGEDS